MECCTCDKKEAQLEQFGAYCSKECREKSLKKLERQIKQSKKRQLESEVRKLDEYLKSGYRTY